MLLDVQVSGRAPDKDTPVLFFFGGFPDDHTCWDALAPRFQKTHTLAVTCWPDYQIKDPSLGGGRLSKWLGYSHDSVLEMLKAAILATSPSQPVTLVAHDWGAAAAVWLATKHPTLIKSLVLLDVGTMTPTKMSIKQALVVLAYQWWLTLAFLVSQFVSTPIGDILIGVFPWKLVGPTPYEIKLPRRKREIHSWMCYPYYHTWSRILVPSGLPAIEFPPKLGIPVLYTFGKRKRIMFHTDDFLRKIEATSDGSRWRTLECGHWIQTEQPDALELEMRAFMEETS